MQPSSQLAARTCGTRVRVRHPSSIQSCSPPSPPAAAGPQEYSGIRKSKEPAFDAQLVEYTHELAALLESRGVTRGERLEVVVEGATHTEAAWAGRLPAALRFLGRNWRSAARRAH